MFAEDRPGSPPPGAGRPVAVAHPWQGWSVADADLVTSLRQAGVNRGDLVALVISPAFGSGLATADDAWTVAGRASRPRSDGRMRRCGRGGWCGRARRRRGWPPTGCGWRRAGTSPPRTGCCSAAGGRIPAWAWARLRGLATDTMPADGPLDLFGMDEGDASDPVTPDGHLRPEWVGGGWSDTPERIARWAELALAVAGQQQAALAGLDDRPMALPTARAESTAELLCAELSADGLPMDRTVAEQVLAGFIGPRPRSEAEAVALRAARDAEVLRHAARGRHRRPAQPGPGANPAGPGRRGRAGHPGLAAARLAGRASAGRRAARVAEGGTDRDHVRLRVAGPAA